MSSPALVNAATRDELGAVIGQDKLASLTERFAASLAGCLGGEGRAVEDLGREAHTLVSMAGMLGFDALFEACRDLEVAVLRGEAIAGPLAEARRLRNDTLAALRARAATASGA